MHMTTACDSDIREQAYNGPTSSVDESLGAKNRRLAKKLNALAIVHGSYGGLDGLSLSYSMVKYGFDLLYTESSLSSSDVMHDWMMTPAGIAAAAVESVFIISFSLLGNVFKDDDENAFKRYISILWPYFRDSMKGLKNAYKGVRGGFQAIGMLSGLDLRYMMVPAGVVLGVLSVANRIWNRNMREKRKTMQANNAELLLEIQSHCRLHLLDKLPVDLSTFKNSYLWVAEQLYYVKPDGTIEYVALTDNLLFVDHLKQINKENKSLLYLSEVQTRCLITKNCGHRPTTSYDPAAIAAFRERIGKQKDSERSIGMLSAAYGGVVDGLYLYMGAFTLATVAPPVFVALVVCSVIYTLACIAVRMYEEFDYQRKLITTEAKVELALCGKELQALFVTLQKLSVQESKLTATDSRENAAYVQQDVMHALELKMREFEQKQAFLRSLVTLSNSSAALAGLRNGLATYSAISSVMFAVATINAMLFVPFPPALLITGVFIGMACLIGFVAHSLITNYRHRSAQVLDEANPCTQLSELLTSLKDKRKEVRDLRPAEVKEAILDGMVVDPSPQFFFQEAAEVARSVASGVAKGQKSVDYTLNSLLEPDSHGHYHDSSVMLGITVISSAAYALGLGVRAYARGFSQDPPDESVKKKRRRIVTAHAQSQESLPEETTETPDNEDNEVMELTSPRPSPEPSAAKGARPRSNSADDINPAKISSTSRYKFFSSPHKISRPASADDLASLGGIASSFNSSDSRVPGLA